MLYGMRPEADAGDKALLWLFYDLIPRAISS